MKIATCAKGCSPAVTSVTGQMLLSAAVAVFAVVALAAPSRAEAGLASSLELCLDNTLTLEARGLAFETAGWSRSQSQETADDVLAHALLISGLDPLQPESWAEGQERANNVAARLREGRGYDDVQLFLSDTHAVVVEPTRTGLHTCLYVGPPQDLSDAAATIDTRLPVRRIGARLQVQGRPPAAQLTAYSLDAEALSRFPVMLTYGTTMTISLDRRGTQ